MYKARVEAVSGTKVRAGGKWLTCIGNKNVRVGDSIWTDGRCVYGNEYTPQQPIVITGGKEDLAIPIFQEQNSVAKCYTYANLLEYETSLDIGNSFTDYVFSNNRKGAVVVSSHSDVLNMSPWGTL